MAGFRLGKGRKAKWPPQQVGGSSAPSRTATVRAADLTVGDYANGIPNIKLGEMVRSFFRQMVWVIPLGLIGLVAAWILTADIKRTYKGEGTIMAQQGDEYVYQPVAGTQVQSSLMTTPDTITLNEIAIMKNPEVMDRVIGEIASQPGGLRAFNEEIAAEMARHREGTTAYQLAYMKLRKEVDESFVVSARPKSYIIDLSFEHEDPHLAVSTLNRLIDAYMSYRRTIFVEGSTEIISQRRSDTESQLRANEERMAAFLSRNGISNFESEQEGSSERTEDLRASLNAVRADLVQAERSLASMEDQLRQTPETIDLYVDDRASNRIAQAELELSQLLARYLPTSDPVRQKQAEIQELRSLSASRSGQANGGRRVGPNPNHQALVRQRDTIKATADALREREFVIQQQLDDANAKLRRLTGLAPQYNSLVREHATLTTRLSNYLNKEQEALINQQQAEASSENVRVISSATYPVKGRNMRLLAFLLAGLFWAFTLCMIALFRVFSDPRLYATPVDVASRLNGPDAFGYEPIPEPLQPYSPATPYPVDPGPAEYQPAAEQASYEGYNPAPAFQPATEYQPDAAYGTANPYAATADYNAYEVPQTYDAYGQPIQPAADGTMPFAAPLPPATGQMSTLSQGHEPQAYLPTGDYAAPATDDGFPKDSDNPYL